MGKQISIGIVLTLLTIGAFAWINAHKDNETYLNERAGAKSAARAQESEMVEVPLLTTKNRKESNLEARYTIDINKPIVALVDHPELAKEANDVIDSFINNTIEKFTTNVREMYSSLVPKDFSSDLTMNWSALLVSPTIISLRFDNSEYVAGAAHPNNQTRILNYDLEKHHLLSTTDLFASSTEALPFLSIFSRNALKTRMADESEDIFIAQTLPGTEPKHENFQEIGITKAGLLIIFDPYQVAPYARGTIEVEVPLSDLMSTTSPGYSLAAPRIKDAIRLATENFKEATEVKMETGEFGN